MYQLNDKIKNLVPYEPISGTYQIRLDANECPVNLPEEIRAQFHLKLDEIAFNRYPDPLAQRLVNSFAEYYEKNDTKLSYANSLRCHNQYLAITVAFGVIGLIWFLFSLIYPFISDKKYRNYYYFIFLFILMLSMLTEDTIETQIGATLFAFFNSFLLFASPYSQQHDDDNLLSEGE